jgi:ankyrin repeat protein
MPPDVGSIGRNRAHVAQDDRQILALLRSGADVNAPEPFDYLTDTGMMPEEWRKSVQDLKPATLLMYAAVSGKVKLAGLLLKKGAAINASGDFIVEKQDSDDSSSIRKFVVTHRRSSPLRIYYDSVSWIQEFVGATALHLAVAAGDRNMVARLIGARADVDAVCDWTNGYTKVTPLHLAVAENNLAIVKLLLKAHCHVDTADAKGKTVLELAAEKGEHRIYDALKHAGASGQYPVKERSGIEP